MATHEQDVKEVDFSDVAERLVHAIYNKSLATEIPEMLGRDQFSADDRALVERASNTLNEIRDNCIEEEERIITHLRNAGVSCRGFARKVQGKLYHKVIIAIDSDDPSTAYDVAIANGYQLFRKPWIDYKAQTGRLILIKVNEDSSRLELRWSVGKLAFLKPIRMGVKGPKLWAIPRSLRPQKITYVSMAQLLQKFGWQKGPASIGRYLGTPMQLIPHLLEFADVQKDDVLVDLGCGDGRVLFEAARLTGCRGIGYERDARLCEMANDKARDSGLGDQVDIFCEDAGVAELQQATVIFLFLPSQTIAALLPSLLEQLPPGGRVVAHELMPIQSPVKPVAMRPLFSQSAVTVAHLWSRR